MSSRQGLKFPSVREAVSAAEWEARVNLAACFRLADHYGMSDMIYTHITARAPDNPEQPVPKQLNYDMWLGPTPQVYYTEQRVHPQGTNPRTGGPDVSSRPGWLRNDAYCLGMITGWGAHHFDVAHWGMNTELTGPGKIEGKGELLASLRSGLRRWDHAAVDQLAITVYGSAAVVIGRWRARGRNGDLAFDYAARFLSVWVNENGAWRNVAYQATEVPLPAVSD